MLRPLLKLLMQIIASVVAKPLGQPLKHWQPYPPSAYFCTWVQKSVSDQSQTSSAKVWEGLSSPSLQMPCWCDTKVPPPRVCETDRRSQQDKEEGQGSACRSEQREEQWPPAGQREGSFPGCLRKTFRSHLQFYRAYPTKQGESLPAQDRHSCLYHRTHLG